MAGSFGGMKSDFLPFNYCETDEFAGSGLETSFTF
jgi:hypothetical protein